MPRNRPPFPVTHGYLDQPTVVDNVETFAAAALIALQGRRVVSRHRHARIQPAPRLLSVSGDCARPGIYEYPFGVTVRADAAGLRRGEHARGADQRPFRRLRRAQANSTAASPSRICPTAGAFMVFDDSRDMFEVARNFVHFFAHESCGFCTPCRVGTSLLKNHDGQDADGHGTPYDLDEDRESRTSCCRPTSHCGLGHTACNPVLDTLDKFRPAYEQRLQAARLRAGLRSRRRAGDGAADDRPRRCGRPSGRRQ